MLKTLDSHNLHLVCGGFGLADFYNRRPYVTRYLQPGGNIRVYENGRDVTNLSWR